MSKKETNQNETEIESTDTVSETEITESRDPLWLASAGLIVALAAFLRFFWLELKPLHHDEGVNGHFLTNLFRNGVYHYDPSNYHGPDLYYLSLAFTKVFGLNTLSVRWSVAIFGLLTVVLALYLQKYIGKIGSLAAALFLALSPGMVYISRYFIHEILFVFLSLAIVVAVLLFLDRRKAGVGAAVWMTLLLMLCFMPVSLMGASAAGAKNVYLLWGLRIAVLLVESVLIFFVMRMLVQWNSGRPIYLILASASAVLLYATKETAFITHGTLIIAAICVLGWQYVFAKGSVYKKRKTIAIAASSLALLAAVIAGVLSREKLGAFYETFYATFSGVGGPDQTWLFVLILLTGVLAGIAYVIFLLDLGNEAVERRPFWNFDSESWKKLDWILLATACSFVFVYLLVLFFTSFFHYPKDISGFFTAYAFWAKTGSTDHTQSGFLGYVKWMLQLESPLVFLSILGTLIAVIKAKRRFAVFSGLWAFGLFLAYSIISYKTPWLALSFTLPMSVVGGYAINELFVSRDKLQRLSAVGLSVLAVVVLAFQTYDLNFVRYDDESMPYVYAHTRRGFEDLIRDAKKYAEASSKKQDAAIEVVTNEYWPMPWYFNDYPNARFHGQLVDSTTSEIIIAKTGQRDELPERYSRHYKYVGTYPLRPGVELYLLVRNDLAGSDGKSLYDIEK